MAFVPGITVRQELRDGTLVRIPLRELAVPRRTLMICREQGYVSDTAKEDPVVGGLPRCICGALGSEVAREERGRSDESGGIWMSTESGVRATVMLTGFSCATQIESAWSVGER